MRLLSCIAATLLLCAGAVQAADTRAERWAQALHRNGTGLVLDKHCASDLAGIYSTRYRTITVCLNNISSVDELYEVIAHEAVHATQHCIGIANGKPGELLPISVFLAQHDPALATQWMAMMRYGGELKQYAMRGSRQYNHNPTTPLLEEEAYTLEDRPDDALFFFNDLCARR